ncbi:MULTISPECIES: hypothetical protein [unclassified Streptomyces]|uniref:hypothetical protein n=1 Tax=unclassified Streptomyces TaxID=2593676 RepID=UPI000372D594|nr:MULTISPECIES: hypothetical protein [unclassified Streptomyces]MYT33906.1 hypothetical protein [Streptomyces sp. SID8354]
MNITFDVPPFFREMAPVESAEEARAVVAERLAGKLGETRAEVFEELSSAYALASSLREESGIVYAANCFGTVNAEVSAGTLTVATNPLVYTDPGLAVGGIARIAAERGGEDVAAEVLDLPCGPVAVTVRQAVTMSIPAEFAESGEDTPVETAQLQAYLAVPGGQELITVTFATPSIRHWPQYCEIMVEFLHSIRLTPTEDDTERQPPVTVPSTVSPAAPESSRGAGGPTPFG